MTRKAVLLLLYAVPLACVYDYEPRSGWNQPPPRQARHAGGGDSWQTDQWGFQGQVTVGPSDVAERPVIENHVSPLYTQEARRKLISGVVVVEARIDATGNVTQVAVLDSLEPGLDGSAVAAVQQWRFQPARLNGEAKPSVMAITVNFQVQ